MSYIKKLVLVVMTVSSISVSGQGWEIPKQSPGLKPDVQAGKSLFNNHCAVCHGSDLKGTAKGPPFLHRIYRSSHHSDMAFQIAAKSGVRSHHWQFGDMPPIPLVTPDSVAHIIAYIRREQQKAVIE